MSPVHRWWPPLALVGPLSSPPLVRFLFDFTGAALMIGANAGECARCSANAIES